MNKFLSVILLVLMSFNFSAPSWSQMDCSHHHEFADLKLDSPDEKSKEKQEKETEPFALKQFLVPGYSSASGSLLSRSAFYEVFSLLTERHCLMLDQPPEIFIS